MVKRPKPKKPIVVFCELRRPPEEIVNISSQNGAEGVVTRMLPKSHVSHVILNANVSEERFLDMKVSTENKMKKKSIDVHNHFINTFKMRLERKQERWIREDQYVSKNFEMSGSPRHKNHETGWKPNLGALSVPTPPSEQILYKKANYPYMSVTKTPGKGEYKDISQRGTLPRIQTVPVGSTRKLPGVSASHVKLPSARSRPSGSIWGEPTNQRVDTASTVMTRMTSRRKRMVRSYDDRFTDLMSWLSPVDAMKGKIGGRSKVHFDFSQAQVY